MRYAAAFLAYLLATGLFCAPSTGAWSFWQGFVLYGGSISPMSPHDTIRMKSMEVVIRLKRESYTIDGLYELFNTSGTRIERVGVTRKVVKVIYDVFAPPILLDFVRFDGWVEGQKVPFSDTRDFFTAPILRSARSHRALRAEYRWMVGQVVFPGHAKTTIRVKYEAPYARYPLCRKDGKCGRYWLGTARYWKGKIGKAAFIVDYTDIGGIRNRLLTSRRRFVGRVVTENAVRYEIGDFEPSPSAIWVFGYKTRDQQSGQ